MTDNATPQPKVFTIYLLIILFILAANISFGQMKIMHFNAGWNSTNDVEWVENLKDCEIQYVDIAADAAAQSKYEIVVVPTIIVFNGKEVKRFQADISFAMKATKKEVQEVVDELLMDQF